MNIDVKMIEKNYIKIMFILLIIVLYFSFGFDL